MHDLFPSAAPSGISSVVVGGWTAFSDRPASEVIAITAGVTLITVLSTVVIVLLVRCLAPFLRELGGFFIAWLYEKAGIPRPAGPPLELPDASSKAPEPVTAPSELSPGD